MANTIDLETDDNLRYTFYPVSSGAMAFKIRAPHDAHLALTTGPEESDPMYEVIIGGWGNTKSVIRRNRQKPDKVEIETPDILNSGEFRGFWVRWDCGIISAGRDGEPIPFISWQDPEPFPINFVGVSTGWGASGTWKIEDGEPFDTEDRVENKRFFPVMTGSLAFAFRGPHDCHVALTSGPTETDPIYEFIIGGWKNTSSVIRYRKQKDPSKVTVDTVNIVSPDTFKNFLIQWHNGRLLCRNADSGEVIMEWTDSNPFPVTHFGVLTGWGARGSWKINHFSGVHATR